jgi:hypothetical protein
MAAPGYPLRLDAALDPPLSRGRWLVKWLLVIPHVVVLALLWVAYAVVSVVALFAILFTGRYPRALFDFAVGVMRWTWRVVFYSYGALGTDRYPPFTLRDVPDYPAHLDVAYPEHLSRGLVLVKWWLLAIPQYVVTGLLMGGGTWFFQRDGSWHFQWGGGLIGILVLVAGVLLLFTGRYAQPLFDLLIGLNRWVMRVWAYAGLLTDEYPPFRLDQGGSEPEAPAEEPAPAAEPAGAAVPAGGGWTSGRVVSLVLGSLAALLALALLAGAAFLGWADATQREDGYLTSPRVTLSTSSYAVTGNHLDLGVTSGPDFPSSVIGKVRIRVRPTTAGAPVFIGIARAEDVDDYLAGVSFVVVRDIADSTPAYSARSGGAPRTSPTSTDIWVAKAAGAGAQELVWDAENGNWSIVVMNPDATAGISVRADVGATVPGLGWFVLGLVLGGTVLLVVGAVLIVVPVVRAGR